MILSFLKLWFFTKSCLQSKNWFSCLENLALIIIIINLLHLNRAFLGTQRALHSKGSISSSTTSVQHPPGWLSCIKWIVTFTHVLVLILWCSNIKRFRSRNIVLLGQNDNFSETYFCLKINSRSSCVAQGTFPVSRSLPSPARPHSSSHGQNEGSCHQLDWSVEQMNSHRKLNESASIRHFLHIVLKTNISRWNMQNDQNQINISDTIINILSKN